jgi:hypothetical protein
MQPIESASIRRDRAGTGREATAGHNKIGLAAGITDQSQFFGLAFGLNGLRRSVWRRGGGADVSVERSARPPQAHRLALLRMLASRRRDVNVAHKSGDLPHGRPYLIKLAKQSQLLSLAFRYNVLQPGV